MDNKLNLFGIAIIFALIVLPIVKGEIQSTQWINVNPQNESRVLADHILYTYLDNNNLDYISGNNPLNVYLFYSIYVKSWNEKNPSYRVDYCNLTIQSITGVQQTAELIYTEVITENDEDINNAKYFIQLNKNDVFIADIYCKYENQIPEKLQMPETMQIVMPSWDCKACQYYEWLQQEQSIRKSILTGNNTKTIINYITDFISLHYEIILTLFWIFLILILYTVIALIFIVGFWMYEYIRRKVK